MNIFLLAADPVEAAEYHVDSHAVKMVTETAQLLSTAHQLINPDPRLYRATHQHGRFAKWVRETRTNYRWTYDFLVALANEYTYRYGKIHGAFRKTGELLINPPKDIPDGPMTLRPVAKHDNTDTETAIRLYRDIYRVDKQHLHKWTKRSVPWWL